MAGIRVAGPEKYLPSGGGLNRIKVSWLRGNYRAGVTGVWSNFGPVLKPAKEGISREIQGIALTVRVAAE